MKEIVTAKQPCNAMWRRLYFIYDFILLNETAKFLSYKQNITS